MGSYGVDIDFRFNTASALKNAADFNAKYKQLMNDAAAGVEGAAKKADQALAGFSRNMISNSTRAARQVESSIRTVERQAEMVGKAMSEQILIRQQKHIKAVGEDTEAVKRLTAAYEKLYKVQLENEQKDKTHGGTGNLLFRGARDIFEGRMTYGVMDIGRAFLGATGGGGGAGAAGAAAGGIGGAAALLGIAGGFGAVAIGAFKAAESIGEFGQKIHEVQIVTGMSAKEVQQFDVAAKMTGHDVTEINRMMRGLTQAVMDTSNAGEKGRAGLRALGVDVVGLQLGTVNATEAFLRMGETLKKQPDVFERNSEMMAIFKRAGIEATGTIIELADAMKRTSGTPFLTEAQIQQAKEMHDRLLLINVQWDYFWNQVKLHAGEFFFTGLQGLKMALPGAAQSATASLAPQLPVPGSPAAGMGMAAISDMLQGRYRAAVTQEGGRGLEAAEKIYENLKKAYDSAVADQTLFFRDAEKGTNAWAAAVDKSRVAMERQKTVVEELKRAESDRKAIAESLRRLEIDAAERIEHPYGMLEADRKMKAIQELHGISDTDLAKAAGYLGPLRYQEATMLRQKAQNLAGAAATQVAVAMGEEPSKSATQFAADERATITARSRGLLESLKRQMETDREALKPLLEIQTERRKNEEAAALRGVRLGGILQPSTIESRLAAESQIAAVKERNADQEAADARTRISQEYTTKENYENAMLAIRLKNEGEVDKAREDYQAKYLEELRHQVDAIKGKIEPLFDTLFKDPKNFGRQLRSTLTDAALKPITSGLSEMTAVALHPLIFGATGTGGIAGSMRNMFGGGRLNDVRLINGAVPVHIVGSGGGGGGGGVGTSLFNLGGWGGGTGPGGTPGFAPGPIYSSGDVNGGAGGVNFGQLVNLPTRTGSLGTDLAMMTLGTALGGRGAAVGGGTTARVGGAGGGFHLPSLAGLRAGFWNENLYSAPGYARAASSLGLGGKFAGVLTSPAAAQLEIAAGLPLATAGAFGSRRGTSGGIAELMGGGALTGAGIGTMILPGIGTAIGAGIGAAAGLGIGVGEMIAGVESPRNEAKRLAQSIYHIQINNPAADQIVSIANQSYGGRVSIAVRSPEVRHMIGLYAAGTGQSSIYAQSANDPHGASLVESGGRLMQQATYQYGQAYVQSSNLPVYGGVPAQTYGSPGGGMQLSLNINGQDAARFMTGQVVTPDVVQTQYASAMYSSSGRVPQALMLSQPGSIAS